MASNHCPTVRLKQPTDFDILDAMSDGYPNVGVNIAQQLGRNRGYINTRLPDLEDYDLLKKVGPAENSGLYRVTPKGIAAALLRDQWGEADDFEELVEERATHIEIQPPQVTDHLGDTEELDE